MRPLLLLGIFATLAVPSTYSFKAASKKDDVNNVVDYIIDGLITLYKKKSGGIVIPDVDKATKGYFGDMTMIHQKTSERNQIRRTGVNPRKVTFNFHVNGFSEYRSFKHSIVGLTSTLKYQMNLKFATQISLLVKNRICSIEFNELKVEIDPRNMTVNGVAKPLEKNKDLKQLANKIQDVVYVSVRENVEGTIRDFLSNNVFDCKIYNPNIKMANSHSIR